MEAGNKEYMPEFPAYAKPYIGIFKSAAPAIFRGSTGHEVLNASDCALQAFERSPDFFGAAFMAISRKYSGRDAQQRKTGYCDEYDTWYSQWFHRSRTALQEDMRQLSMDKSGLCGALAEYLKEPRFHSEWLDWYFANTIVYSELLLTCDMVETAVGGAFTTSFIREGGASAFAGIFIRFVLFVIKWGIWLAAAVALGTTVGTWGVLGLIALTIGYLVRKYRGRAKVAAVLAAMRNAYDVFATPTFSWEIAWLELNKARELGAVWPGELYKLVEIRRIAGLRAASTG